MFKRVVIIFLFFLFLVNPNLILAEDSSNSANIQSVNHIANGLEKLQEKITLFFKFSKQDKAQFLYQLAEKRLAELKYAVDSKNIDSVEETASRYQSYVGNLAKFLIENHIQSKDKFNNMVTSQKLILSKIQSNFEFESGWWLAIQHDINILDILKLQISNSGN